MYTDKNIVYALNPLINVHNQFIETYLGLGLFGLSCLIIMLFSLLYYGIRNKYLLPIMFAVIIFFNFNFESMLNTQAGVFFFAFFFCLSFIKPK
jgi:O-antigen ligase